MIQNAVLSERKVAFTAKSAFKFSQLHGTAVEGAFSLILSLVYDRRDDTLMLNIGFDPRPDLNSFRDEVFGIRFFWYAESESFALMSKYIVDLPQYGPPTFIKA